MALCLDLLDGDSFFIISGTSSPAIVFKSKYPGWNFSFRDVTGYCDNFDSRLKTKFPTNKRYIVAVITDPFLHVPVKTGSGGKKSSYRIQYSGYSNS